VHECEEFFVAELSDTPAAAWNLQEALAVPGSLSDEVARGGWFCRFYSRLSPADLHFLESTLEVAVGDAGDGSLLAVALDFRPQIALFLFVLEDGLYEIVLMPWESGSAGAEEMSLAAADVLFGIVAAVGWSPQAELRRFADEL
jgi:hypothetical protein